MNPKAGIKKDAAWKEDQISVSFISTASLLCILEEHRGMQSNGKRKHLGKVCLSCSKGTYAISIICQTEGNKNRCEALAVISLWPAFCVCWYSAFPCARVHLILHLLPPIGNSCPLCAQITYFHHHFPRSIIVVFRFTYETKREGGAKHMRGARAQSVLVLSGALEPTEAASWASRGFFSCPIKFLVFSRWSVVCFNKGGRFCVVLAASPSVSLALLLFFLLIFIGQQAQQYEPEFLIDVPQRYATPEH